MRIRTAAAYAATIAVVIGVAASAWYTRDTWRPWLTKPAAPNTSAPPAEEHAHAHADRVGLSPQAVANLKLVVEPVVPESYWRAIQVPGVVVDRPGQSDRGVTAPVTGVVAAVHAQPGDTVRVGDVLFTLRLTSELVHNTQVELFKATQEVQFNREQLDRLSAPGGSTSGARIIDLQNQDRRLTASVQAYRQELLTRGLTAEQIDAAARGRFVTEVDGGGTGPGGRARQPWPRRHRRPRATAGAAPAYEVQELKVHLGEQVQAGQVLCLLANHRLLYVEGRAFK